MASYLALDSGEPSSSFVNGLIRLDVSAGSTAEHSSSSISKAKRKSKQPASQTSTANGLEATGGLSTPKGRDVKTKPKRAKTKVTTNTHASVQPLAPSATLIGAHVASQPVSSVTSLQSAPISIDGAHVTAHHNLYQALTSVDALRATNGHGCTIYDSTQTTSSAQQEWSRPVEDECGGFNRATAYQTVRSDEFADFFDSSDDLEMHEVQVPDPYMVEHSVTHVSGHPRATARCGLATPVASDIQVPPDIEDQHEANGRSSLDDDELFMDVDDLLDEVHAANYSADTVVSPNYTEQQPNVDRAHAIATPQPSTDEVDSDTDKPEDPIVRPPFPASARDRSPIIGLSSTNVLRVCFRLGEALNAGCEAVRANRSVFLEVYAKVKTSYRRGYCHHFVFGDLFSDRTPTVHGIWEQWKGVDLWERDSRNFLKSSTQRDKLCRCIGTMKRDNEKWKLAILNIWEASWNDVNYAKGIICA